MSRPRFLPQEVRDKLIDLIATSFDVIHAKTPPKYRADFVSDKWTDTKLIRQLEILGYWAEMDPDQITIKKRVQDIKEEVADYILLEELNVKTNSSD